MAFSINRGRQRRALSLLLLAATLPVAACISKDRATQIVDPDLVNPADVGNAPGAESLRLGALSRLTDATSGGSGGSLGEGVFFFSGLLGDEWRSGDTFFQRDETDKRSIQVINSGMTTVARQLYRLRTSALQTIPFLTQYRPTEISSVGQMYWIKGYAELLLAENFCNGTPVSTLSPTNEIIFGKPETNIEVYTRALASLDSAVLNSPAGDPRADTVKNMAAVERGRILLDLGRFVEAGNAVVNVPDNLKFFTFHSAATVENQIWALNNSIARYVVGERDGGVGLNFATAQDPRVPVCIGGSSTKATAVGVVPGCLNLDAAQTNGSSFDGFSFPGAGGPLYNQEIWPNKEADVAIVTGAEARLIEAEAALRSNNIAVFLQKLNYLRTNFTLFKQPSNPCNETGTQISGCPFIPATAGGTLLPQLTDPGTQAAREDLLFRERAFWLWSTAHRLADMRRLVRPVSLGGFGRAENTVYPNGTFFKGGVYGDKKALVIPQSETQNTNFTACLDNEA